MYYIIAQITRVIKHRKQYCMQYFKWHSSLSLSPRLGWRRKSWLSYKREVSLVAYWAVGGGLTVVTSKSGIGVSQSAAATVIFVILPHKTSLRLAVAIPTGFDSITDIIFNENCSPIFREHCGRASASSVRLQWLASFYCPSLGLHILLAVWLRFEWVTFR